MKEKLTKIADYLEELAELLRSFPDTPAASTPAKETASEPVKEEGTVLAKETTPEKGRRLGGIKLEDVRAVLADLSRKGHTREMKALLSRFGADRLSGVPKEKYADLLAAAKEVPNA